MHRILAVLGLLVTMSLVAPAPAHAGEVPPTVQFHRAWTVAGGAAVEIAYKVSCPDPEDAKHDYRHALSTNYGYLEFRCGPKPRRVVMLVPATAIATRGPITVHATVYTPQCLYWDSSELENGEQGCWKISRTNTVRRLKPGAFVPESSVDIASHVEVRRVVRTRDGGLRLTATFSCLGGWNYGWFDFGASQVTRAGYTASRDGLEVTCDNEAFTRSFTLPRPASGPFQRGHVVVDADWVYWPEGGPWSYYSGLHRLR